MWSNPRVPYQMTSARKRLEPLDGKPLMVHLAMNIEYWPFDRPMPRGIVPPPHGAKAQPPDVPNYSWVEYGMRAGLPRLMRMLSERGLPASAFLNAQVCDVYPALTDAVIDAGWELVGHGWFQQSLKQAEDEGTVIRQSLARLRQADGKQPRAWLGPGLGESFDTPDILKAEGIEFLHDWTLDDLPVWMRTKHGPMVGLPYTFELNDVPVYAIQNGSSDEYFKRVEATLAVFQKEPEHNPRVMTLALHPHIIGVPHIAYWFEQALGSGIFAAMGILVALAEREKSGQGLWVQTSLLQAQIAMMDFQAARYLVDGEVPGQAGNDHPTVTPMGVVATSDGHINLGVGGDGQWLALCDALGRDDLRETAEYATMEGRTKARKAIWDILRPIFATKTSAEWIDLLEAHNVPAGPIHAMDAVFSDLQVMHLGMAQSVNDPVRGDVRIVGLPIDLSRTPARITRSVPDAGQQTDEILTEMGLRPGQIAQLRSLGVI